MDQYKLKTSDVASEYAGNPPADSRQLWVIRMENEPPFSIEARLCLEAADRCEKTNRVIMGTSLRAVRSDLPLGLFRRLENGPQDHYIEVWHW